MSYRIEFAKQAAKQFRALSAQEKNRLQTNIDSLAQEPCLRGSIKLAGEDNLYRVRVGNYRIIYTINNDQLLIVIVKVGHRRDVYR